MQTILFAAGLGCSVYAACELGLLASRLRRSGWPSARDLRTGRRFMLRRDRRRSGGRRATDQRAVGAGR